MLGMNERHSAPPALPDSCFNPESDWGVIVWTAIPSSIRIKIQTYTPSNLNLGWLKSICRGQVKGIMG